MAERLHIIMPCSRPWNLSSIVASYLMNMKQHPFEIRWHIMVQGPEPDAKGYNKCNEGAKMCNTGWLWFPSDDSLQEPTLFQRLGESIERYPNAKGVVFSEKRRGHCPYTGGHWPQDPGILRARPDMMKPCHIDGTQVFFHHSVAPHFDANAPNFQGDGFCIQQIYQKHKHDFVFMPNDYVLFGSLDPIE